MMPHIIRFGICNLSDIECTAAALANTILANRKAIDAVIESIHTTAVSQVEYARSIAILARKIEDNLDVIDIDLAVDFRENLIDEVISTYFSFWTDFLGHTPKHYAQSSALAAADPIAISAFIGDLLSTKMITFGLFEWCLVHLLDRVTTRLHLRCLHALFARGCAHYQLEMSPDILSECRDRVRKRCIRVFGCFTMEEQRLRELFWDLIFRPPTSFYPDVVDRHLDLDGALMASVCPSNWHAEGRVVVEQEKEYCTTPWDSRVVSPTLSVSSEESELIHGFAEHMKEPVLHHPRPVRPPSYMPY